MDNNKIKVKDKWAEKYLKDNVWYPFGSIVNGWAIIKQNSPNYTPEDYLQDLDKLFNKAMDITLSAYKIYTKLEIEEEGSNSPDIPILTE